MEKLKYRKLEVMLPRIKNKTELPVDEWTILDQSIEVLQLWLIITVYHLLVKDNKGEGEGRGGGLKEKGELIYFLPLKRGGGLLERGGLIEGLQYSPLWH